MLYKTAKVQERFPLPSKSTKRECFLLFYYVTCFVRMPCLSVMNSSFVILQVIAYFVISK